MAAYFKIDPNSKWIEWHVGEPLPPQIFEVNVLTIQVDGHEMDALLDALK